MKAALSEDQIKFLRLHVAERLADWNADIFLFGSRAQNLHNKNSDVDLLIRSTHPDVEGLRRAIHVIREHLENSAFPYAVDLVLEQDIAKSYYDVIKKEAVELWSSSK